MGCNLYSIESFVVTVAAAFGLDMSRPDRFSKLVIQNPGDHSCDLRATWHESGGAIGCREALLFRCVSL